MFKGGGQVCVCVGVRGGAASRSVKVKAVSRI